MLKLSVAVQNTGRREGDEVVMVYHIPRDLQRPTQELGLRLPHRRLLNFDRLSLTSTETKEVSFNVSASDLGLVDTEGNVYLYPGKHVLVIDRGNGPTLENILP